MMEKERKGFDNIGQYKIREADLPLSCPLPSMVLWNAHPKVYLPIEATKEAVCPYCSAHYFLVE